MISSDDEARAIRAEEKRKKREAKKLCNDIEVEKANLSLHLTEEAHIATASYIAKTVNDMLTYAGADRRGFSFQTVFNTAIGGSIPDNYCV